MVKNQPPQPCQLQKGKSCLERRRKRCQTDVQQGQPLRPCIAPRALRGHPSSRVEILQCALHDACADKNFFTKTPPHQHKNTTTGSQKHHHITPPPHHKHSHHKNTTKAPPSQKRRRTTTKTPPHHQPHHHHTNKPPLGIERMTFRLLSGCNAN